MSGIDPPVEAGPSPTWDRPGRLFYAVALAFAAAILFADSDQDLMTFVGLSFLGCVFGVTWLVLLLIAVFRARFGLPRQNWARWLGIPAIGLLCLSLVLVSAPLRFRFELSRQAFHAAATRMAAGEELAPGPIGLFNIDGYMTLSNGFFFEMDSAGFIDPCGLAYSREGRPDMTTLNVDLGGGWWFACDDF